MKNYAQVLIPCLVGVIGILAIRFSARGGESDHILRLVSPPAHIEDFTFGYNDNYADTLWLRVIQDFDYCEQKALRPKSEAAPEGYEFCHSDRGWVFHMLDAITTLAPKFRMPYNHGATLLSIQVGDKLGAKEIFERGIKNFPTDWSLEYRAAYHFLYELDDPARAAALLVDAGKNGAPSWVFSLAARIYSNEGRSLLAKSVLESALEEDPDSKYAELLKVRLKQLNEIMEQDARKKANGGK